MFLKLNKKSLCICIVNYKYLFIIIFNVYVLVPNLSFLLCFFSDLLSLHNYSLLICSILSSNSFLLFTSSSYWFISLWYSLASISVGATDNSSTADVATVMASTSSSSKFFSGEKTSSAVFSAATISGSTVASLVLYWASASASLFSLNLLYSVFLRADLLEI